MSSQLYPPAATGAAPRFLDRHWLVLVSLLTVAGLSIALGQIEFGSYDCSMLIDLGWRQIDGQRALPTLSSSLPPMFIQATALAARSFGNRWVAYTAGESVLFLLLCVIGITAVRICSIKAPPASVAKITFCYLCALAIPTLTTNHLWHSSVTAQIVVCWMLILLLILEALGRNKRVPIVLWCLFATLQTLALLLKPNTAWVAITIGTIVSLCTYRTRSSLIIWSSALAASAGLSLLALYACGSSASAVLRGYLSVSDRPSVIDVLADFKSGIKPVGSYVDAIGWYALFTLALILVGALIKCRRIPWSENRRFIVLAVTGCAVTLVGWMTNIDLRSSDVAPAFFGMGVLLIQTRPRPGTVMTKVIGSIALLIVMVLAADRTRMKCVREWAGPRYGALHLERSSFFGPFLAREAFWSVNRKINSLVAKHQSERIFFGPRLEYNYARLGISSPRDLPIWWHPGSSYAMQDEQSIVRRFERQNFQIVILSADTETDLHRFPVPLLRFLNQNYSKRVEPEGIIVFVQAVPRNSAGE